MRIHAILSLPYVLVLLINVSALSPLDNAPTHVFQGAQTQRSPDNTAQPDASRNSPIEFIPSKSDDSPLPHLHPKRNVQVMPKTVHQNDLATIQSFGTQRERAITLEKYKKANGELGESPRRKLTAVLAAPFRRKDAVAERQKEILNGQNMILETAQRQIPLADEEEGKSIKEVAIKMHRNLGLQGVRDGYLKPSDLLSENEVRAAIDHSVVPSRALRVPWSAKV
jgi:hypothetical protein